MRGGLKVFFGGIGYAFFDQEWENILFFLVELVKKYIVHIIKVML